MHQCESISTQSLGNTFATDVSVEVDGLYHLVGRSRLRTACSTLDS